MLYKNVLYIFQKVREKYQNLYQEEKEKKWQYGHEPYKNLSEDETKACLVQKKYYRTRKNAL